MKVIIRENSTITFEGDILNIPITEEAFKQKSLELIGEEDPCIIHRAHIKQHFADRLKAQFDVHGDSLTLSECSDVDFIEAGRDAIIEKRG